MRTASVDGVDPAAIGEGAERRRLSEPLGTTGVAINHYRIPPCEGFPGGLHAHADQEEVFYVLEGEATFETPDGAVSVGAGEAVRFAPGEFQTGRNDGADELVALALGAPRESEDVRVPRTCPECGRPDLRVDDGVVDDGVAFVCPDCDAERVPAPCPDCGGATLEYAAPGSDPVVVCRACGLELDDAPLRE
jgi:uncharacterized cupin superfamily protein